MNRSSAYGLVIAATITGAFAYRYGYMNTHGDHGRSG